MPQEQTVLAAQIEATDRQVHRLLYGPDDISPLRTAPVTASFRSFIPNSQ